MQIEYMQFEDERSRRYSIATRYEQIEGNRKVVKSAIYAEGASHLDEMLRHADELKNAYPNVEICPVYQENGELIFDYSEGETLSCIYDKTVDAGDKDGFIALLKYHKDIIIGGKDNTTIFRESDKSREWFGSLLKYEGKAGLKITNLDAIGSKIVRQGERTVFVDYEWVLDFEVPETLAIYYCIRKEYLRNPKMEALMSLQEVMHELGYNEQLDKLEAACNRFWTKIIEDDNGQSFAQQKQVCLKKTVRMQEIIQENEQTNRIIVDKDNHIHNIEEQLRVVQDAYDEVTGIWGVRVLRKVKRMFGR